MSGFRMMMIASACLLAACPAAGQYCGVPGGSGSYLNARFGFEIGYAGGWHRLQVGPHEDGFLWVCRDTVVAEGTVLDVRHIDFVGERTHADSLRRAVTHRAALFCAADGTESGSYCEEAETVESFVSGSGLPVMTFYQAFVYEDYAEGTKERRRIGPYFAVDISRGGQTRALLLSPGPHRSASERYAGFVRMMAESVRAVDCDCR